VVTNATYISVVITTDVSYSYPTYGALTSKTHASVTFLLPTAAITNYDPQIAFNNTNTYIYIYIYMRVGTL